MVIPTAAGCEILHQLVDHLQCFSQQEASQLVMACPQYNSHVLLQWDESFIQWEFQDPKMEVLWHIRPYFVGIP